MARVFWLGGPWSTDDRKNFAEAVRARYPKDAEKWYEYVNSVGERFIVKASGLLAYDALVVVICAIPISDVGLSTIGNLGILFSVASAILIMWAALRVRWVKDPNVIKEPELDFLDYVGEVANRGIAVNVGLYLAIAATVFAALRVLLYP